MAAPTIRVTVDRRLALTIEQAAERYRLAASSMRGELTRLGDRIKPVAMLDGRKPLYLATELDKLMKSRPGKGGRGVARKKRSAE